MKNKARKVTSIALVLVLVLASTALCFADGATTAIESGVKEGLQSIYKLLIAIALPIAAIALAVAGFNFFMGGERGADKARKIIIYTVIGVVVVFVAPLLIEAVQSWFGKMSDTSSVWQ